MYLRGDEAHEYNQNMAYNSQRTTKASNFFISLSSKYIAIFSLSKSIDLLDIKQCAETSND